MLGQFGPVLRAFFLTAIAVLAIVPAARSEVAVDVALVLAVDVSRVTVRVRPSNLMLDHIDDLVSGACRS